MGIQVGKKLKKPNYFLIKRIILGTGSKKILKLKIGVTLENRHIVKTVKKKKFVKNLKKTIKIFRFFYPFRCFIMIFVKIWEYYNISAFVILYFE